MKKIDQIEKQIFLEGILQRYGYDFRQYAPSSFDRRLQAAIAMNENKSLIHILANVFDSKEEYFNLLNVLTVHTTEFFRDPAFFLNFRQKVIPTLKKFKKINIWIAGCSSGEEVISIAIILQEEQLLDKVNIYATDIDKVMLKKAKAGIYNCHDMLSFSKNYVLAGGKFNSADYFSAEYGLVKFNKELLSIVTYFEHNLATCDEFIEANVVICRNVLIYFNRDLQNSVIKLFLNSLTKEGFIGLGPKETTKFSEHSDLLEDLTQGLYKIKGN